MTKLEINSAEDMQKLGASLAKTAKPHDLLLLNGDLGAGKTTMTQGLGRELGIHRPVKSPTFTIVREYREAKMPLFHMDFYRLEMMIYLQSIWKVTQQNLAWQSLNGHNW